MEFRAFPKLQRLSGPAYVTEKIDGTNACIVIDEQGLVLAQSRTRMITPQNDNFGFAAWVFEHSEELAKLLGPGYHYGEWWGRGIQRGYGLNERRFSLFNTSIELPENALVSKVPLLFAGTLVEAIVIAINYTMPGLKMSGSIAAPGFMYPEGVVIYDSRSKQGFKRTLDYDENGKGLPKDQDGNVIQKY